MMQLDAGLIREFMSHLAADNLTRLEVLAEIDSTNSYLMRRPGPEPEKMCIAVTSNQTAGRGRCGKSWQSPPGSGLCLSIAYTFAEQPDNLPALTLAIGLSMITALQELGADNVQIKWPNDLVAEDGKLGGILTEVQQHSGAAVTVVTGVGINIDIQDGSDLSAESGWATQVVDLKRICSPLPSHEKVAGTAITQLFSTFVQYESYGFAAFAARWPQHDWLLGRTVTLDVGDHEVAGMAGGIAEDGALLIETASEGVRRITSGSVVSVGSRAA